MGNPLFKYPSAIRRGQPSVVYTQVPWLEIAGDPSKGWAFFDDFLGGRSSTTAYKDATTTVITAGTLTNVSALGGILALTPGSNENEGIEMQWIPAMCYPTAGTTIAFGARLKLTDADQSDTVAGLVIQDTTAVAGATDQITFRLADGSANILQQVSKDSVGDAASLGVAAEDITYVTLEILVDGVSSAKFYIDNVLRGTITANICDNEALAPTIAIHNGAAAANILYLDYMYAAQWYK